MNRNITFAVIIILLGVVLPLKAETGMEQALERLEELQASPETGIEAFAARALTFKTDVDLLITLLVCESKSWDENIAREAITLLGQIGPRAATALPWLVDACYYDKKPLRLAAIDALAKIGPNTRDAAAGLLELLEEKETSVREAALKALNSVSPDAAEAMPFLIYAAVYTGGEVRKETGLVLTQMKLNREQQVKILISGCKSPDPLVQLKAVEALFGFREEGGVAVPFVIQAVRNKNRLFREKARSMVGYVSRAPEESVPALVKLLEDPDPEVRLLTAKAIDRMSFNGRAAIPALKRAVKDQDSRVREAAISALGRMQDSKKSTLQLLIDQLKDEDPKLRIASLRAIDNLRERAKTAVPAIINLFLNEKDPAVRRAAVSCLMGIRTGAEEALPVLILALEGDPDTGVRSSIARTLPEIDPEGKVVVPFLVKALEDTGLGVKPNALFALLIIGPNAKDAVPTLAEQLNREQDVRILGHIINALAAIGVARPEIQTKLRTLLNHQEKEIIRSAAYALVKLKGNFEREGLQVLIQLLSDDKKDFRNRTAYMLGELGPSAAPAIPALLRTLKDEANDVRQTAANALGKLGPTAKPAVPALIEALKDDYWMMRREAGRALGRIGDPSALPALREAVSIETKYDPKSHMESAVRQLEKLNSQRIETDRLEQLSWELFFSHGVYLQVTGDSPAKPEGKGLLVKMLVESFLPNLNAGPDGRQNRLRRDPRADIGRQYFGPSKNIDKVLAFLLKAGKDREKAQAARLVSLIKPSPDDFVKPLTIMLNSRNWRVKAEAAEALGTIAPANPAVIQGLARLVRDRNKVVSRRAIRSLAQIPADDNRAVLILASLFFGRSGPADNRLAIKYTMSEKSLMSPVRLGLKQADDDWLVAASTVIPRMPTYGRSFIPDMIAALPMGNRKFCENVKSFVQRRRQLSPDLLPVFTSGLDSELIKVKHVALTALRAMGAEAAPALARIELLTGHPLEDLRNQSLWVLREITGNRELTPTPAAWTEAARPAPGPAAPAPIDPIKVDELIKALPTADKTRQIEILRILPTSGEGAAKSLPTIIRLLSHAHWRIRYEAVRAIKSINPNEIKAVKAMIRGLSDRDADVSWQAARSLACMRKENTAGWTAFLLSLRKARTEVKPLMTYVLETSRINAGELTAIMVANLDNDDTALVTDSLEALGALKEKAVSAVPAVVGLCKNTELKYKALRCLAHTLKNIDAAGEKSVPLLKPGLRANDSRTRRQILKVIGHMKVRPDLYRDDLHKVLQDSVADIRIAALNTIISLKIKDEQTVKRIRAATEDKEPEVRAEAFRSLGHLDIHTPEIFKDLKQGLTDPSWEVRSSVLFALSISEFPKKDVFDLAAGAMRDTNMFVRDEALDLLLDVGEGDPKALPILIETLKDPDAKIRKVIRRNLKKYKPDKKAQALADENEKIGKALQARQREEERKKLEEIED
ncbi:HEAT repeat domain-containing protein [Planctomycetota bacterium]